MCRFNWTDSKINSSNLVELSGQITEKFDEEFRILYAQSLPLNLHAPPVVYHGGVHEHLKHPSALSSHTPGRRPAEAACLTSTPTRIPHATTTATTTTPGRCKLELEPIKYCTAGGSWEDEEELLAGSTSQRLPPFQLPSEETRKPTSCHVSTQTSRSMTGEDKGKPPQSLALVPPSEAPSTESALNDLYEVSVERQRLYSSIRSKLEHTVARLSAKRELADIGGLAEGLRALSRQRAHEPNPRLHIDCGGGVRGT